MAFWTERTGRKMQSVSALAGLVGGIIVASFAYPDSIDPVNRAAATIAAAAVLLIILVLFFTVINPAHMRTKVGINGLILLISFGNIMIILATLEKRSIVIPDREAYNLALNIFSVIACLLYMNGWRRMGIALVLVFAVVSTILFFVLPANW